MTSNEPATPPPVTLVLDDGQGNQHSVELQQAHKKRPIYVAVGQPGHRSEIWRIWANQGKDDVYVSGRHIADAQKWSLHESGDWRHQWVSGDLAEQFTGSRNRILDQWPRGPAGAGTFTYGISIWVPSAADVIDVPDDRPPKDTHWLPVPEEGRSCGIHIGLAQPDQGFFRVTGAVPIDGFVLGSGEVLLVLTGYAPLTDEQEKWLRSQQERARRVANIDTTNMPAPRMGLMGFDEHNNRVIWDLAADARQEPVRVTS